MRLCLRLCRIVACGQGRQQTEAESVWDCGVVGASGAVWGRTSADAWDKAAVVDFVGRAIKMPTIAANSKSDMTAFRRHVKLTEVQLALMFVSSSFSSRYPYSQKSRA